MSNRNYQELLQGLLDWDLKVLNPWKEASGPRKLSKRFHILNCSQVSLVLVFLTFAYFERRNLTSTVIMENISTALVVLRSAIYLLFVVRYHGEYTLQFNKMHDDRKLMALDQVERLLTNSLCRRECVGLFVFHLFFGISGLIMIPVFAYLFPNNYQLPLNCYILVLPLDGFMFAWELNYAIMLIMAYSVILFTSCYMALPLLLMNQTCWLLDMALITADQMNTDLMPDDEITDQERGAKYNNHLKTFIGRCEKIVEWRNEVQDLLFWNFNLEFQIQSTILCFSILFLSLEPFTSLVVLNIFTICLVQLFVYCRMGTKITNRIDQVSLEISKNWYLLKPKQRKEFQMILHWTQNMKTFTGTFNSVSMETFQSILNASYSFYTFLRSSNE